MPEQTIRRSVDAWIDEAGQGHFDHAGSNLLRLNGGAGADTHFAYLHFTRPFPLGATVISATLRLTLAKPWNGLQSLIAKRVIERWWQERIRWSNRPGVAAANEASVQVVDGVDGQEVEIDVTDMLADVASGADYFGFQLSINQDVLRRVYSTDAARAENRPVLEVEWGQQPYPPARMAPSGGRVVSLSKPVLDWAFRDNRGDTQQLASQVQISTTADFSAPEYDSGKVANTLSSWDLADTAYAGVPAGETRWWRVRVWDGLDFVSEWSDKQQFAYVAQPALTINNPPESGIVEETTPTIDWSFPGQDNAEVVLFRINPNSGKIINRLERWPDLNDTDVKVPPDTLRSGRTYRVRVRAWDSEDRQGLPGAPAYVQATREFTYARDGTPAPVTNLTAELDSSPKVVFRFDRVTMPDYFSLRRNGEEVLQRISATDAFESGTSYEFAYWGARPRETDTYEVEAVVNDLGKLKHSAGNDEIEVRTRVRGIWLVDPEDGQAVMFAGQESAEARIGVAGEVLYPKSGRRPVQITEQVRGYEGSVSGTLLSRADRDRFLRLAGRLKRLRLIFGDLNFPMRIEGEPSAAPAPVSPREFEASFSYFQDGEFDETLEVEGG